jgi:hypothetical protein
MWGDEKHRGEFRMSGWHFLRPIPFILPYLRSSVFIIASPSSIHSVVGWAAQARSLPEPRSSMLPPARSPHGRRNVHAGHQAEQAFLRGFPAGDFGDDSAGAHHEDSRGEVEHLGQFG